MTTEEPTTDGRSEVPFHGRTTEKLLLGSLVGGLEAGVGGAVRIVGGAGSVPANGSASAWTSRVPFLQLKGTLRSHLYHRGSYVDVNVLELSRVTWERDIRRFV